MIKNLENILIGFLLLQKKYYGNPQPLFKNNYIPMRKILAGIMRTYGRKIVGNFVASSLLLLIRNLQ